MVTRRAWLAVVGLASLSSALAYLIYFRILARAGAVAISLVTFLIPFSAAGLGWLVLGERLEVRHLVGLALILGGLALIERARKKGLSAMVGGMMFELVKSTPTGGGER